MSGAAIGREEEVAANGCQVLRVGASQRGRGRAVGHPEFIAVGAVELVILRRALLIVALVVGGIVGAGLVVGRICLVARLVVRRIRLVSGICRRAQRCIGAVSRRAVVAAVEGASRRDRRADERGRDKREERLQ